MSTTKRILSGSIASWARILITILSQVVLVPLYLSHWDVINFGVWLAIQALIALITTLDFGFQTYLEFEFLKIGASRPDKIGTILSSGLLVGFLLSCLQILIILALISSGVFKYLLDIPARSSRGLPWDAGMVLLIQGLVWMITTSPSGLMGRALAPFGYFPRSAWWNVAIALAFAVSTAVSVILGYGLFMTGLIGGLVSIAFSAVFYLDYFRLLKKCGIVLHRPNVSTARTLFVSSTILSGKIVLDIIRQQGVRLLLGPLSGIITLAAFSTTRTISNFAMQGLNTLTSPLMPELMRFMHGKEQDKFEASIGSVWIVLILVISPAMLVLQYFITPIFESWTHGKIAPQPALFAMLSLSVLVFAWAQPAISIVRGNNLLRPQIFISIVSTTLVIILLIVFVKLFGLVGAGLAILIPEVVASIIYRLVAMRWLAQNQLKWPDQLSRLTIFSILAVTAGFVGIIYLPAFSWQSLALSILLLVLLMVAFWRNLPVFATGRITRSMLSFTSYLGIVPVLKRKR